MNAIAKITNIHTAVAEWRDDLTRVMASDVSPDKFIAAVTTALTMNPDIVSKCTPASIKNACIKAAYDGLRPDGKEGALVAYGAEAQWMPMVYGVRKKAKDHDDIIITAREVREKDHFEVVYGLREDLIHNPDMSARDRGPIVATYAVFRKGEEILHFEVMTAEDIDKVRAASKASNSPAWRNWYGEMGKKAAVNRGSKSVPMSDAVRQVIDRDNDLYDLEATSVREVAAPTTAQRFSAPASGQGFDSKSVARQIEQTSQMPLGSIDRRTGEIIEQNPEAQSASPAKQTMGGRKDDESPASAKPTSTDAGGPGNTDTGTRAQNNSAGDDAPDAGGESRESEAQSAVATLSREVFETFSGALARVKSVENLQKAKDEFFKGKGMRPTDKEKDLFQTIYKAHEDRIKGGLDVGKVMSDVAGWIAEDVPEEKL